MRVGSRRVAVGGKGRTGKNGRSREGPEPSRAMSPVPRSRSPSLRRTSPGRERPGGGGPKGLERKRGRRPARTHRLTGARKRARLPARKGLPVKEGDDPLKAAYGVLREALSALIIGTGRTGASGIRT